jgi:hypothetical protein
MLDSKLLSAIEDLFQFTRSSACPFGIVSRLDQTSIVFDLQLKGLSAQVMPVNLVATLDHTFVAYSMVTRHLRDVKLDALESTLNREPISPHLDDSDRAILAAMDENTSRFGQYENLPKPPMSHELQPIEDSPNRSGSYNVFSTGCLTFCQTLRKCGVLNYLCLSCEYSSSRSRESCMTLQPYMSHGSAVMQIIN